MRRLIPRILKGDERAFRYLLGRRHPHLDRFMRSWTHLGDAATTIGATLTMIAIPSPVWRRAGLVGAVTLAGSHLAVQLLKRTISRPRPHLPVGLATLIDPPDRFSFPSGHSAAAMSVAMAVAIAAPLWLAPWLIGAGILVGLTRVYLGVHYPGDVIAGWILAGAACIGAIQL